jgi:hypothetical protein
LRDLVLERVFSQRSNKGHKTSAVKNEGEPVEMVMQVVVDFVRQIVSEINQNILAVVVEKRDKQEVPNIIKGYIKK